MNANGAKKNSHLLLLAIAVCCFQQTLFGAGSYSTKQVSSGAFDHESPSLNNHGDLVWSQKVGSFWQVYVLRSGAAVPVPVLGQATDHNNTNPAIDDSGDVMYLKDGVGQGVQLSVILNRGGTEGIVEFSSRNGLQHRDAGKHFGIAGDGTRISYFDFGVLGAVTRTFDVNGSSLGDFTGADFPDINSDGMFVYSSGGTIFSAKTSAPRTVNRVGSGEMPRIADLVPSASAPEIVYVSGQNVISSLNGTVDEGFWADVNRSGAVVYEKKVDSFNQIFLATSGCGKPQFSGTYPTSAAPAAIGSSSGWHMSYNVSDKHGLELKDVSLGTLYMAETINLPFYRLQTSGFSERRCTLVPDGDPTLGDDCTSHLIDFSVAGGTSPEIKATYEIDNISDDHTSACVLITQHYQFSQPIYPSFVSPHIQGCEPSDSLACAKFQPVVAYQFMANGSEETLDHLNTAQQLHFTVNGLQPNTAAIFKDSDIPIVSGGGIFQYKQNPLQTEIYENAIRKGGGGSWDNFHQTFKGYVEEPADYDFRTNTLHIAGCDECVHMHWRWGHWADLLGLQDFGGGNPILFDSSSNQDVYFAVANWHPGQEDPNNVADLVTDREPLSPANTVFWYSATGYRDHDTFFYHGAFFSPPSSGPATLTVTKVNQQSSGGNVTITLAVSNSGPGTASNVSINQLPFRTLLGTGTALLTQAPGLPFLIGDLPPGRSQNIDLTFSVPTTARELLIQEGISYLYVDEFKQGHIQGVSFGQTIFP